MPNTLLNKTIVVTRSEDQADGFVMALRNYNADVILAPTICLQPPASWADCDNALRKITDYDWLIFTSVNSVTFFKGRADALQVSLKRNSLKIAAVGQSTADKLQNLGLTVSLIPEIFSAKGLLNEFSKMQMKNQRVLAPGAENRQNTLQNGLKAICLEARFVTVYRNEPVRSFPNGSTEKLKQKRPDVLTFTSPSTFKNMLSLTGGKLFEEWICAGSQIAVIGNATQKAIQKAGYQVAIKAEKATTHSLAQAISTYYDE